MEGLCCNSETATLPANGLPRILLLLYNKYSLTLSGARQSRYFAIHFALFDPRRRISTRQQSRPMLQTDTADTLYIAGRQAANDGRLQDALTTLSRALAINPDLADAHYERGNVLRRLDRTAEAERALCEALRLNPKLGDAYFSLTFLLRDRGRLQEIESLLKSLAEALPNDRKRIEQAAGLLADYGCLSSALKLFQHAVRLEPELPRLYLRIGQTQQKLGDYRDAQNSLMDALNRDPLSGPTYLLLAHNGPATDLSDERIGICERALDRPDLPDNMHICLRFAIGKLLDDVGEYERAFTYFKAGNRLRRAQTGFDWETWQQYFFDLRKVLPIAPGKKSNPGLASPVFIVGMPRSGTTLIHNLLSNHPDVLGLGETEMVDQLVESLASHMKTRYPQWLAQLRAADFNMLAEEYRLRWPRESAGKLYVLDKNPLNFLHIGLISRLFPDARFIHCQRDPRDVALSVYFQHFAHPRNSYAYDLADIGRFYGVYHDLMKHWQAIFAAQLCPLQYEHFVSHPEQEMRKLLLALELDWNDACIEPETGNHGISTASVWQARQPIYADSVGRWLNYENHLKPFLDALPDALVKSLP
jgi:tetratricopeptide (TPR) repeat protein